MEGQTFDSFNICRLSVLINGMRWTVMYVCKYPNLAFSFIHFIRWRIYPYHRRGSLVTNRRILLFSMYIFNPISLITCKANSIKAFQHLFALWWQQFTAVDYICSLMAFIFNRFYWLSLQRISDIYLISSGSLFFWPFSSETLIVIQSVFRSWFKWWSSIPDISSFGNGSWSSNVRDPPAKIQIQIDTILNFQRNLDSVKATLSVITFSWFSGKNITEVFKCPISKKKLINKQNAMQSALNVNRFVSCCINLLIIYIFECNSKVFRCAHFTFSKIKFQFRINQFIFRMLISKKVC